MSQNSRSTMVLEVGDMQSFVFASDNAGPFWMTQQQS
jgi:hypothetical protein